MTGELAIRLVPRLTRALVDAFGAARTFTHTALAFLACLAATFAGFVVTEVTLRLALLSRSIAGKLLIAACEDAVPGKGHAAPASAALQAASDKGVRLFLISAIFFFFTCVCARSQLLLRGSESRRRGCIVATDAAMLSTTRRSACRRFRPRAAGLRARRWFRDAVKTVAVTNQAACGCAQRFDQLRLQRGGEHLAMRCVRPHNSIHIR